MRTLWSFGENTNKYYFLFITKILENRMKNTVTAKELGALGACEPGYEKFVAAFGEREVTFLEAYKNNGWDDFWWYISEIHNELSYDQNRDLRLLRCDYAEDILHIFESEFPDDKRPREAIEVSRRFANGAASQEKLAVVRAAAWATVYAKAVSGDAARAARAAVWAAGAARATVWAAGAAARAAGADTLAKQEQQLIEVLEKWSKN